MATGDGESGGRALGDERYLLVSTFRRDGTAVATAVWAVPLGDRVVGFWTSSASGKVKRLAHTERVTVQPCDARGRPRAGSEAVEATAKVVTGQEYLEIRAKVEAKYGLMTKATRLAGTLGALWKGKRMPYGDRGVVVTLRGLPAGEVGKVPSMPKVNPESGEMMSDHPDVDSDSERGGKQGSSLPKDANPTGSDAVLQRGRVPDPDRERSVGD